MAATDPVIVGVGMMTAVGLTAPETAASVRAATMRYTETSIRDRRFDAITSAVFATTAALRSAEPAVPNRPATRTQVEKPAARAVASRVLALAAAQPLKLRRPARQRCA